MVKTCVTCNKDFSEQSEVCPLCGGLLGPGTEAGNESDALAPPKTIEPTAEEDGTVEGKKLKEEKPKERRHDRLGKEE